MDTFDDYIDYYEIEDMSIEHNMMYILYSEKDSPYIMYVDVREFAPGYRHLFTISNSTVNEWPGIGPYTWYPIAIYTVPELINVLFVQCRFDMSNTTVIGMRVSNMVHKLFLLEDQKYSFDIALTQNSLFQIYDYEIYEHSLNNINNVKIKSKEVEKYGYKFEYGITSRTNFFYGRVFVDEGPNVGHHLFIFRSGVPLVDTLYATIHLEEQPLEMNFLIAVDGVVRDTVAIILDQKLFFFRVPIRPALLLQSNLQMTSEYIKEIEYKVFINPMEGDKEEIQCFSQVVNTGTKISIDEDTVKELGIREKMKYKQNEIVKFEEDLNKLAFGSVLEWKMVCDMYCDGENPPIKIINKLQLNSPDVGKITDVKHMFFDNSTDVLYVLTRDSVYAYNQTHDQVMPPISLQIDPDEYECYQISPAFDDNWELMAAIVTCTTGLFGDTIIIPINFNSPQPWVSGQIVLQEVSHAGEVFWEGDLLLVGNDIGMNGGVYIYDIDFASQSATVQLNVDKDYLAVWDDFVYSTFSVSSAGQPDLDKLFIIDRDNWIHAINFRKELLAENKETAEKVWTWDFIIHCIENKLFFEWYTTVIWSIEVMNSRSLNETHNSYHIQILSSNTGIYYTELIYDETSTMVTSKHLGVFNVYGSAFKPYNMLQSFDELFAASFYNEIKNQYLLAVYDISLMQESSNAQGWYKTMSAGYIFNEVRPADSYAPFLIYKNKQKFVSLATADPEKRNLDILDYTKNNTVIIDSTRLKMKSGEQAVSVNAKLQPVSLYEQDKTKSDIKVVIEEKQDPGPGPSPGPSPSPTPKPKNNTWWIVLLVVFGVLAIAGVIGWYIYQKRRGKTFLNKDEDLISLQKPLPVGKYRD